MDFAAALATVRKQQPNVSDVHIGTEIGNRTGRNGKRKKRKQRRQPEVPVQVSVAYLQKRVRVDVTKLDEDQRLVFGWFSVSTIDGQAVVDKQDDVIDTVDLEKAVYDYVLHHRAQGDMHGGDQKGRLVESMMFTAEKQQALGIDLGREGWFGGFRVDDAETWKAIRGGSRPEFSIGGTAVPIEM